MPPGQPLSERLTEALETIAVLRVEVDALLDEVAALEVLVSADLSTKSKPPSGDPVATCEKRAERRAEAYDAVKWAQGKQPGAPGANLTRRRADRVIGHEPPACRCCGADLTDAAVVDTEVRQVIDLPRVTPTVTDHVVYKRKCPCGG